jgi:benzoyl-CoA reductase subunit B
MTAPQDKMAATLAAQAHQKETQARFRTEVIEGGGDYVIADAVTPHEIFHTLDIPVISLAWYSAVIAAKRLSPYYFDLMDRLGYHDGLPRYGSLPFMTTLDADPDRAPYGGLPKPMLILERLRGDVGQKIGEQWARAFGGAPLVALDSSSVSELRPDWFKRSQHDWEELYETPRLDFQVEQLRNLIAVTETLSHRTLDMAEFRAVMHRVNRAGELVDKAKQIIARTRPAPVSLPEQLTNIMAATWSRGSQWSIDHLQAYCDELEDRAAKGVAACPNERLRLLWVNNGLWFNTGFYREFEQKYGGGFRLVDVFELLLGRLPQVFWRGRGSAARIGGAAHLDERAAPPAGLDGGMDHPASARLPVRCGGDAGPGRRPDGLVRHQAVRHGAGAGGHPGPHPDRQHGRCQTVGQRRNDC